MNWNGATRKTSFAMLAILVLFSLTTCTAIPTPSPTPSNLNVGYYISHLTYYNGHLYFGAGHCLYELAVQNQSLRELQCAEGQIYQRPVISQEMLFVHIIGTVHPTQQFIALDIRSGATVWHTDELDITSAYIPSQENVVVSANSIITVLPDTKRQKERVCALDIQKGTSLWCSSPGHIRSSEPLSITDDLVWFLLCEDTECQVIAVDSRSGETRHKLTVPEGNFDQLLLVDPEWIIGYHITPSCLLVLERNRDIVKLIVNLQIPEVIHQSLKRDDTFVFSNGREIKAINLQNGNVEWLVDDRTVTAPTAYHATSYPFLLQSDAQFDLCGINLDNGDLAWKRRVNRYSLPLVNNDIVYIADEGSILSLDIASGNTLWEAKVNSSYQYYSSNY